MRLNKFLKRKNAQQLIEFAFIAPILILIMFIIMEFGYALTIRNTVSEGMKAALLEVNKLNNLTGTATDKKNYIENSIYTKTLFYLSTHNIPNATNVKININTDANGVSVVTATYVYKPILLTFFMSNVQGLPLQSSQVINSIMFNPNTFNSGLTTQQLSSFFPTPSGALTTGGMINSDNTSGALATGYAIRDTTAILVNWYEEKELTNVTLPVYARLFSWYGEDLLPPNERINIRTATIEVRSPYYNDGNWFNTNIPYVWVISALGYTNVYFVKYNSTNDLQAVAVVGTVGYTLNSCNSGRHFGADTSYWANSCPLAWDQGFFPATWYPYLYKINPLAYNDSETGPTAANHSGFFNSFGYRWCGAGGLPICTANQNGYHTIQELALKGISREGVYSSTMNFNFHYNVMGNSEYVRNTATAPTTLEYWVAHATTTPITPPADPYTLTASPNQLNILQHYTAQTTNKNNYDGNYLINIWQPTISTYYTSADEPVDPNLLNSATGPLYTAFQWSFTLNAAGVMGAGTTYDITDVYLDSDGDGVPNAWDDKPDMFDADGNGDLDGLQDNAECVIHDNGNHHSICTDHPEDITVMNQAPDSNYEFPVPGVDPLIATPFDNNGNPRNVALNSYVPQPYPSDFKVYHGRLYIVCDGNADESVTDLCRQFPTWGSSGGTGTVLGDKARFINGTSNGAVINLNQSTNLNYLNANNFSPAKKITRTPPTVW